MSAALIEVCGPQREYHFFDSFSGLPPPKEIDGAVAIAWQKNINGHNFYDNCSASEDEFLRTLSLVKVPPKAIKTHPGYFEETVPHAQVGPIGLLRLDADWYESTMICLKALLPKVMPGGLIIIDDYGTWDGCTRAVHDYLAQHKRAEPLERYGAGGVPYLRIRTDGASE